MDSRIFSILTRVLTVCLGKRITILGARGTGKTTLWWRLKAKELDSIEYEGTPYPELTRKGAFKWNNSNGKKKRIRFRVSKDLPGSIPDNDDILGVWKEEFESSQTIFYTVNGDLLLIADKLLKEGTMSREEKLKIKNYLKSTLQQAEDEISIEGYLKSTLSRVEDDLASIQEWNKNNEKPICIIGTYFDKVAPNYHRNIAKYQDKFSQINVIKEHGRKMEKVIGSLAHIDSSAQLLARAFERVLKSL